MRIQEIPIQTRYFPEASQIGFRRSVRYGFAVLGVLARYKMQKQGSPRQPHLRRSAAAVDSQLNPSSR